MLSNHPIRTAFHRVSQAIGRSTRAIKERLLRYFLIRLVVRTLEEMSADDATHMAAGVAYYALFSLFPLLLVLIVVLSMFIGSEDLAVRLTDFAADYLPGAEDLVASNIKTVQRLRGALGVFGFLGLVWSASAVFGAVTRAVNRAWDVHKDRPLYISKPRQLAMALAVGVLFALSLGSATFARATERISQFDVPGLDFLLNAFGRSILQGSSFVLVLCIFLLIYKLVPNTKTYWRFIWPGAVVAAVLFELTKNLFIIYLNRLTNIEDVYGSVAPVLALLLWTYVSSLILILGAELSSEYGRMRQGVARGVLLHPDTRSDRDDTEE